MAESLVHVVLVVEAEATNVHGVGVEVIGAKEIVGHLLGLGVTSEEGQALGTRDLELAARRGREEGAV